MSSSFAVARWTIVAGALGVWSGAAVAGAPALVALQWMAASVLVAAILAGPGSSVVGRLPVASLLWVCWIVTWSSVAHLTLGEIPSRWGSGAWGPVAGAAGIALISRPPRMRIALIRSGEIPALAGALLLLGAGAAVVIVRPFEIWSRNFFYGTDFTRHVTTIGDLLAGEGSRGSGYPMGFHELARWSLALSGVTNSPRELWIAAAALVWACVALTMLGIGLAVQRIWKLVGMSRGSSVIVALAWVTYSQSFWFDRMMSEGYVINYLMGLALVAGVAGMAEPAWWDSRYGLVGAAAVVSVTANAWQLFLGVAGSVALVTSLHWIRTTRRVLPVLAAAVMVAWLSWRPMGPWLASLLSPRAAAGPTPEGVVEWMGVKTPTGLGPPGWWWWTGLALSVCCIAWGVRSRNTLWASAQALMLAASAGTFLWMYLSVGGSWYFLAYYPAKFLSTALLLVIPLGCVGLGIVVSVVWALASRFWSPTIGRAIVVGLVAVGVIGAAGWSAAKPPRLWLIATSGLGLPPFNLAMAEQLAEMDIPRDTGTIVFGLLPDATPREILGGAAVVDSVAMETLGLAGFDTTIGAQAKGHVSSRTWDQICLWLKEYPRGIVVTGPNPDAGLPWLRDFGCPEEWIDPSRWVSVPLGDRWIAGLEVADRGYRYPTYAQFVRESQPADEKSPPVDGALTAHAAQL